MVALAHAAQIGIGPVPRVPINVVNHISSHHLTLPAAYNAQGVEGQEAPAYPPPCCIVATLGAAAPVLVMLRLACSHIGATLWAQGMGGWTDGHRGVAWRLSSDAQPIPAHVVAQGLAPAVSTSTKVRINTLSLVVVGWSVDKWDNSHIPMLIMEYPLRQPVDKSGKTMYKTQTYPQPNRAR